MEENSDIKTNWYVMQVMSGQENKVFNYLDFYCSKDAANVILPPDGVKKRFHSVFAGLIYGIYELNIPFELVDDRKPIPGAKKGTAAKKPKERKLYPGYVLIRMQLQDQNGKLLQDNLRFIKDTKGVIGLIGDTMPVPLSAEEAAGMMKVRNEAAEEVVKPKVVYNVGESVIIRDGAFVDCEGVIESVDEERNKLHLSVSMFGRFTPVEVDFWQVERPQ